MDYSGFSAAEQEALKAKQPVHTAAEAKIVSKLGAGWKLCVDWPTIAAVIQPCDKRNADCVYDRYVEPIGDEMASFSDPTVRAVNDIAKGKKIVLTMGPVTDSPSSGGERYDVSVGDIIKVTMNPTMLLFGYPYSEKTTVSALIEATLPPPPGAQDFTGFTLGEVKKFQLSAKEGLLTAAIEKARSKLGPDWKIVIDWCSISKTVNPGNREYVYFVYEKYVVSIGDEIAQMNDTTAVALNSKVSSKTIRITMAEFTEGRNCGGERYQVALNDAVIVTIHPNALLFGYPYSDETTVAAIIEMLACGTGTAEPHQEQVTATHSHETCVHSSEESAQESAGVDEETAAGIEELQVEDSASSSVQTYGSSRPRNSKPTSSAKPASKPAKESPQSARAPAKEKEPEKCWVCRGTGEEKCSKCTKGMQSSKEKCSVCKGKWQRKCHRCGGKGAK